MNNREVREYYEKLASEREKFVKQAVAEDRHFWSVEYGLGFKDELYRLIFERMRGRTNLKLLDVGCGYGYDFAFLKGQNLSGFGIDLSFSQLERASADSKANWAKLAQAEVGSLPFKDHSFDIVIFSEVIEHLPDCRPALKEIHRVLKDDGVLFLTTPNRYDYFHFIGSGLMPGLRKLIKRIIQTPADIDSSQYSQGYIEEHVHLFSLNELTVRLEDAGFAVREFYGGRLRVMLPRLFDRYAFLQRVWAALDNFISRFPQAKVIKANFIVVMGKEPLKDVNNKVVAGLEEIFALRPEMAQREISARFYSLFDSFFKDRFKFMRYIDSIKKVFSLVDGRNKIILDAGCGFGIIPIILSSLGAKGVWAIDFSPEEISGFQHILSRLPPLDNLNLKPMDCARLKFPDNFFDVVLAMDSISHILNLDAFFCETKRVLKPGGLFYIYESNSTLCFYHQLKLLKYWKMIECGPVDPRIDLKEPFREIRRQLIRKYFPEIKDQELRFLSRATMGMQEREIKEEIGDYRRTGKLKRKEGFRYVDPRTGMYAERPLNPFALKKELQRLGFNARVLAPYFYFTGSPLSRPLGKNSLIEIMKSYIKLFIRHLYPFSMFTTPRYELLAVNEKR